MKNLHYIIFFVLLALCSCKKQIETEALPFDKLYILEYDFALGYGGDYSHPRGFIFRVEGFCELDKDFNLQNTRRIGWDINGYIYKHYNSENVPDSMRNIISDVLSRYQMDTTFLDTLESGGIYDRKDAYRFIMQKHNQKDIIIKFKPDFLPEDLKFVYLYLYKNQGETVDKSRFDRLFEMFENQVKDDTLHFPPPPLLKSTIKFTPLVIKGKK
jgi:hypothetical protein